MAATGRPGLESGRSPNAWRCCHLIQARAVISAKLRVSSPMPFAGQPHPRRESRFVPVSPTSPITFAPGRVHAPGEYREQWNGMSLLNSPAAATSPPEPPRFASYPTASIVAGPRCLPRRHDSFAIDGMSTAMENTANRELERPEIPRELAALDHSSGSFQPQVRDHPAATLSAQSHQLENAGNEGQRPGVLGLTPGCLEALRAWIADRSLPPHRCCMARLVHDPPLIINRRGRDSDALISPGAAPQSLWPPCRTIPGCAVAIRSSPVACFAIRFHSNLEPAAFTYVARILLWAGLRRLRFHASKPPAQFSEVVMALQATAITIRRPPEAIQLPPGRTCSWPADLDGRKHRHRWRTPL